MSAEAGAFGILKWLVGLILAPWLWHERKMREQLQSQVDRHSENYFTKGEVKELIELHNRPIIVKLDLIHQEIQSNRGNKNGN